MRNHGTLTRLAGLALLAAMLVACAMRVEVAQEAGVAQCQDGLDNDRDGLADCADPACSIYDFCATAAGCSVSLPASGGFSDSCLGNDICICPSVDLAATCEGTGTCSYAFDRPFVVRVFALGVAPDGCWDVACNAPDPFVEIVVDGVRAGFSPAASDVTEAAVGYQITTMLRSTGSTVVLRVWDEDFDGPDEMFTCTFGPLDGFSLRSRSLACSGPPGTIVAGVFPL